MHVVSEFYAGPGAKELFDLLDERKADVEALLRGVDWTRVLHAVLDRQRGR